MCCASNRMIVELHLSVKSALHGGMSMVPFYFVLVHTSEIGVTSFAGLVVPVGSST